VVIVTWNAKGQLLECLTALRRNPPSVPWDAIVIDNGSNDGTVDALRREAPWAQEVANPRNRGLAAANNQGIAATTGDYILIANPDTTVCAGAVDALVAALDRHERAAFAIPRLLHPDGSVQVSAGDLPTLSEALLGRQMQRRGGTESGFWWDGWAHDEARTIGRGHEACYLVRREAVNEVGLQDERFVLDWEGIDWTARARALGWEVRFEPSAEVVHLGGASIRQARFRWIISSHRGMYRYFAKRSSVAARPIIAFLVATRGALKAIASLPGRRTPVSYERAHQGPDS
jgi:GT2 family glycosyltransferase